MGALLLRVFMGGIGRLVQEDFFVDIRRQTKVAAKLCYD